MATRGNIGIVNQDGSITSIYVHWDSYPEYVGKILLNHYTTVDSVNELMKLGDLSSLGENLFVEGHTWKSPIDGVCVAYGRDRGEKNIDSVIFEDIGQFEDHGGDTGSDYQYLFDDGVWSYRKVYKGNWKELTAEVCKK